MTDAYERRYPQVQVEERTNRPGRLTSATSSGASRTASSAGWGRDQPLRLQHRPRRRRHRRLTSQGLTGSFGFGTKWYFGKWFAVRIDIRDHILKETLIGRGAPRERHPRHGGVSIFFPFGG